MATKQQKQLAITGVLLLVFVIVLANSISTVMKKKKAASAKKEEEKTEKTASDATKSAPSPASVSALSTSGYVNIKVTKEELLEQEKIAESEWAEDPFFHGYTQAKSEEADTSDNGEEPEDSYVYHTPDMEERISSSFNLTGITKAGNTYIAVINRSIVKVGDSVSTQTMKVKIKDIKKDRVLLEADGGEYELKLQK